MSNAVLPRATKNSALSPSRPNSGWTNASAHSAPRCRSAVAGRIRMRRSYLAAYAHAMRIIVLGAGNVGRAVVEALHDEHELTVIDTDAERLSALADRYDVRTVEGNGTTKRVMREAGVQDADLLIACSPREDANLVSAMLARKLSRARVIVRTSSPEYLEAWREREIDVDFMVSSELETANAISSLIGIPAARQTDVFADGKVQIVEFDVPKDAGPAR